MPQCRGAAMPLHLRHGGMTFFETPGAVGDACDKYGGLKICRSVNPLLISAAMSDVLHPAAPVQRDHTKPHQRRFIKPDNSSAAAARQFGSNAMASMSLSTQATVHVRSKLLLTGAWAV